MHLAIFSCAHGRADITTLWARHLEDIDDYCPVDISVHVAVTNGDTANLRALGMWDTVEAPNMPLGAKHNTALGLAYTVGADAYMVLPSDDFVSMEWIKDACAAVAGGAHYVCPVECALYDQATGQACILRQKERGVRAHGAARVFSAELVRHFGGVLYTPERRKGLDTDTHIRITAAEGVRSHFAPVYVAQERHAVCDVKAASGENLWPYRVWARGKDAIGADEALWMVSDDIRNALVIAGK